MIIVDYSQIAISTLMAELAGRKDVPISVPLVRHMLVNAMRSFKYRFGRTYGQLVIACDDRRYWRKEIFEHYKASRKKAREDSGFDWQSIFEALNMVKQELSEHFPYPVIEVPRAEADDVIASLVFWSQNNDLVGGGILEDAQPQPILILSQDHDFQQLQMYHNVEQYAPVEKKFIKNENPNLFLVEHILRGDKGDGIPNFLSPAETFVTEGMRQKNLGAKADVWKHLSKDEYLTTPELKANFERNERLVDLRCIPQEIQDTVIDSYTKQVALRKDRSKLLDYFVKYQMPNMMEHLNEF